MWKVRLKGKHHKKKDMYEIAQTDRKLNRIEKVYAKLENKWEVDRFKKHRKGK